MVRARQHGNPPAPRGIVRGRRIAALLGSTLALAVALGFVPVPAHRPGSAAAADPQPLSASVRVPSLTPVRAVPRSFFGLSTEYWTMPIYETHLAAFERVLSLLHVQGDGPLVLRIGGDSADHSRWIPAAHSLAPWIYRLTPSWLSSTAQLIRQMGLHVILDMNLVTGSPPAAAQWARVAEAKLPHGSITGFEVGNEPDIYSRALWIADLAQARHRAGLLPTALTANVYRRDFGAYAQRLGRIAPGVPLLGPAIANPALDAGWISRLLSSPPPSLRVISAHRYPYSACARPGQRAYPTIGRILSERATAGVARAVSRAVRLAHGAGLSFRLSELNSVTCGGLHGVSNTFATALWAPDALFELLRARVDAVNLHVREYAVNAPFTVNAGGLHANPLLYGLLMFTRTLGPDAQLLRLQLHTSAALHLKAWAVRLRTHAVHVLIIDKGARSATVEVKLPSHGSATVQRLLAPSVTSSRGVTLAGQHLAANGSWQGRHQVERVGPTRRGYRVALPGHSAALVSVHGR